MLVFLRFWFGFNFISLWTCLVQSSLFWGLLCLLHALFTHCYTPKSVLSSELKSALGDSSVVQWLRLCFDCRGHGFDPRLGSSSCRQWRRDPLWSPYWWGSCMLSCFSHVWLFATLWTVAHHTPLSMEFSRQECWSGSPCSPPGDLPNPGVEPVPLFCLLRWQVGSLPHTDYFLIILDLNVAQVAPWRRQWHPTPVLLPGKSHGWRSLVGCSPWGREESDTTEWLPFHFHALEKAVTTHSSVLARRIPGTGEPGGLPSMGSHRVGHDWSNLAAAAAVKVSSSQVYLAESCVK